MKHSELKRNDIVLFLKYNDILEKEDYQDGSIVSIYPEQQKADIVWLEGYSSWVDSISFSKIIAKYDKEGVEMSFGAYKGPSVLFK